MQANLTHILPLALIRRARTLPQRGRVLVHSGQKVNATDVVAECSQMGRHILLDIRRALNLQRTKDMKDVMERSVGEFLQKGDIIAQTGGIFSSVVRAPENCEIIAIQRGQVLLETDKQTFQLTAGMTGVVVEVMADLGVVIETNGALIQGVWGNNQIDVGLLQIISQSPEEELTRPQLDMTLRGAVVVAGHITQADVLDAAGELPVRGLILGSMTSDLIAAATEKSFPIVLLEGFGRIPINAAAYKLLLSQAKRDVSLNSSFVPLTGERPELIIPLPAEGRVLSDTMEYKTGMQVKIIKPPYTSQVGTLGTIRPGLTTLPNGLRAPAAEVRLETNEQVIVPLANLVVIE